MTSLQFLQLNMNKAKSAAAELHRTLPRRNTDVVLLTEPTVYKNKVVLLPKGYVCHPNKTFDDVPRAAILFKRSLNCTVLDHLTTRDCTAMILPGSPPTLIFSAYLDAKLPVAPTWLDDIISYATSRGFKILGGFDSNAHHTMYGYRTDKRGRDLTAFLFDHSISIANRGKTPTYDQLFGTTRRKSVIDLTITHQLDLSDWRVDTSYNGSDHNTILFSIPSEASQPLYGRRWSKADWPLFRETLDKEHLHVPRVLNPKKLDKMVRNLYRAINNALKEACPKHVIKPSKPYSHWYNDDHKKLAKKLRKQYTKMMRVKNDQETSRFHKLQAEYNTLCQQDRRQAWRKFTSEATCTKSMARLQKILKFEHRALPSIFQKPSGEFTEPGIDSLTCLTDTHFPTAQPITHEPYNSDWNTCSSSAFSKYDDWINETLVTKALLGFEDKKSPGPDELKPIIFKYFTPKIVQFLTLIYKGCIYLHYTPKKWKQTRVIFIPKPGKDSHLPPKNSRPISLSNYLLKGLERLAVWRVDEALAHHPLHSKQHEFLRGRSTESALSNTVDYAERALFKDKHCLGIFLDISAAFDSISVDHVRDSLLKHGADDDLVYWYHGYLKRRDLHFNMQGVTHSLHANLGFPQGGVCSAKFWIIAFDPAVQIINQDGIEGNGYADDISALYSAPRFDSTVIALQKMLDKLIPWGASCNLNFNANKTIAVVFSRSRKSFNRKLRINGQTIPYSNTVKYLGITLDRQLFWKTHILLKIDAAKKLLYKLKSVAHKDWGPTHLLMRWAYLGIIRPMLTYGALVWAHEIKSTDIRGKLQVLNRLALSLCTQVPKSTPNVALETILNVAPLDQHIIETGLTTFYRLQTQIPMMWSGTTVKKRVYYSVSHKRFWLNKIDEMSLPPVNSTLDACHKIREPALYHVDIASFLHTGHQPLSAYNVFTDGSKLNGRTGAGFSIQKHTQTILEDSYRLPDTATVFQGEIFAIKEAASELRFINDAQYIKIFVDSQAALLALHSDTITSNLVEEAVSALNKAASKAKRLSLVWTKAHCGNPGNERADFLAKQGTEHDVISAVYMPSSHLKRVIRDAFYTRWQSCWDNEPGAEHTKQLISGPNKRCTKHLLKLPKHDVNLLIRLITNHTSFLSHKKTIDKTIDDKCRLCLQHAETFVHLVQDCPALRSLRTTIFLDKTPSRDVKWTYSKMRLFARSQPIRDLLRGYSDEDIANGIV